MHYVVTIFLQNKMGSWWKEEGKKIQFSEKFKVNPSRIFFFGEESDNEKNRVSFFIINAFRPLCQYRSLSESIGNYSPPFFFFFSLFLVVFYRNRTLLIFNEKDWTPSDVGIQFHICSNHIWQRFLRNLFQFFFISFLDLFVFHFLETVKFCWEDDLNMSADLFLKDII